MSNKERECLKVMVRLDEGTLTPKIAAQQLKIGKRQLRRLRNAYHEVGDQALISKRRGKKSNNRLSDELKEQSLELIQTHYSDFGPKFAQEKLVEVHNLVISVGSVRNLMLEHKIWRPRKFQVEKVHKSRARRECYGELIQMDGSYHDWFEGRGPKCCLLVVIDDATSSLLALRFVEWESIFGYFGVVKDYLKMHGVPLAVYTDRLAVFETTRKNEKNYKDTQFHRALKELGINLILALSPQAKGRVERVNGVLQDRLVKEMRLAGISTIEAAIAYLPSFISAHNKKFAKKPLSPINAHKVFESEDKLEKILCLHHERKITKDLMVYWGGKCFQISEPNCQYRLGGKKVLVLEKEDKSIELIYENKSLAFVIFGEQVSPIDKVIRDDELITNWKKTRGGHPPKDHPWKQWGSHSQSSEMKAC